MEIQVSSKKTENYRIVTSDSYEGLFDELLTLFPDAKQYCIISDETVWNLYGKELAERIDSYENIVQLEYIIQPGEKSKDLNIVSDIVKYLNFQDFSRNDVIIALGGGVVSDLAGFAASVYKRGVSHIILPTTLLAMADASIGGKTAVDFEGLKNLIGCFKMPSLIYMNLNTLKSLPEREYYAGFAEIMKAALLRDAKFYEWLIENMYEICDKDINTLTSMLESAITIKKLIVEKDPFDHGDRALLNLGHTFGHAIESYFHGEYLHGEAVALGCVAAAFISWKMDFLSMEEYYEIRDMFVPFNLPISIQTPKPDDILDYLYKDKKNEPGKVNMVLLKTIGKAFIQKDIPDKLLHDALNELNFKDED